MSRGRQPGFTLTEMLLSVVLLGAILGAVSTVAIRQQRARDAIARRIAARRAVHEGALLLRGELRALGPLHAAGPAIGEIAADHVEFRSLLGSSVACAIDPSRTVLDIPGQAPGGILTSWTTAPVSGDTVLVYASSVLPDSATWMPVVLAADPSPGGACPVESGLADDASSAPPPLRLRFGAPLAAAIRPGASLRFVRTARYQLYRGGDGRWYLGYADCLATRAMACAAIQPVSGPYAPGGVRFAFLDSAGSPVASAASVARVAIVLRSEASGTAVALADSLTVLVTLRN